MQYVTAIVRQCYDTRILLKKQYKNPRTNSGVYLLKIITLIQPRVLQAPNAHTLLIEYEHVVFFQ